MPEALSLIRSFWQEVQIRFRHQGRSRCQHRTSPLNLENLEDRNLLAVYASLEYPGSNPYGNTYGNLFITGSSAADKIVVRQVNGRISIDGASITVINYWDYLSGPADGTRLESAPSSWVKKITITAGDGDDRISLSSHLVAGQQAIKPIHGVEIRGEGGNDRIFGSQVRDIIYGGTGNDTIRGYGGNDLLRGESGQDWMVGGTGNDILIGSSDKDTLFGEKGNDVLYGQTDDDVLYGGEDQDSLYGGDGSDTLRGGKGQDYLDGGEDYDYVYGGPGWDTFRRRLTYDSNGFYLGPPVPIDDENMPADRPVQVSGAFLVDPGRDNYQDVVQQGAPNCAFLAAVAAVAHWTGRFPQYGSNNQDLTKFITYDSSTERYGVLLYIDDSWTRYWVNGDWNERYDPAGDFWVTLYYKAYLQAMGVQIYRADGTIKPFDQWTDSSPDGKNWRRISYGIQALTGYSTSAIKTSTADAATLRSQLLAGDILAAATLQSGLTTTRLIEWHCYAILDVYQNSAGKWFVKLYNPWGKDGRGSSTNSTFKDGVVTLSWNQFKSNFPSFVRA